MSVSQSIFGVWRHLRALHALTGHHARNAPKTSRYYGLQGPFGGIFGQRVPSDGLQYVVQTWSSDTTHLIQTNFPRKILSISIVNDRIQCLGRGSSPHLSKMVKN